MVMQSQSVMFRHPQEIQHLYLFHFYCSLSSPSHLSLCYQPQLRLLLRLLPPWELVPSKLHLATPLLSYNLQKCLFPTARSLLLIIKSFFRTPRHRSPSSQDSLLLLGLLRQPQQHQPHRKVLLSPCRPWSRLCPWVPTLS